MSIRSTRLAVVATMMLAAAATGCGGGSGGDTASTETGSDATSPSPISAPVPPAPDTTLASTRTLPSSTTPASTTTLAPPPLYDFAAATSTVGWSVVNDTVMGGVSTGQLAITDGVLVFTGELSLDNNGGFASVRSPLIDPQQAADWADRIGPRIQAEGDGRTWTVEVRTDAFDGGWISTLTTTADSPTDVTLPWASFEPVTRFLDPRDADGPLDPSRVASIAFYLVDGVEAPFRLGIRSIS